MGEALLQGGPSSFRQGMKAGAGIAIGYAPIALTYGLLAKTTGLSMEETILMSLIVFAGASQYIALNLLAIGTGAIEIILTTFIVNIRHFLLAASINEKSSSEDSIVKRAIYAFGLTDETFSVAAMMHGKVKAGFMFGLNMTAYVSWVLFSGLGHVFGANLPDMLQESMSVALYAMFIGLLTPSMKGSKKTVFLAVTAAAFNSVFTLSGLSAGWSIVLATLLSSVIIQLLDTLRNKGEEADA
ncbi:AzlC family ABC transporter permease [Actinomycetes bacterium NPDC127524]